MSDLGKHYLEKVTKPIVLSDHDQDRVVALIDTSAEQCMYPCPVCGTLTEHRAVFGGRRFAENGRLVCMRAHPTS